jgi:hypothetical protein
MASPSGLPADSPERPAAAGRPRARLHAQQMNLGDANDTGRSARADVGETIEVSSSRPLMTLRRLRTMKHQRPGVASVMKRCGFQALLMIQMDQDGQRSVWLTWLIRVGPVQQAGRPAAVLLIDDHSLDARPRDCSLVRSRLRFVVPSDCRLFVAPSLTARLG